MPEFQYLGGDYGQGRLESALNNPAQTFNGRYVYRTIHDKAAILLWSIIKNHPFLDGNKRMGLTATHVFMILNGHLLYASREDAVEICLRVAGAGGSVDICGVKRWLRGHSISIERLTTMGSDEVIDWAEGHTPFAEFRAWATSIWDRLAPFAPE